MNVLRELISDLREKRLWPVALVLLVALIVVPVLLSSSSTPAPVAPAPGAGSNTAPIAGLPAVSVAPGPSSARLTGAARDPFTQRNLPSATTGATGGGAAVTTVGGGSASTVASASTAHTTAAGTTTTTTTSPGPAPKVIYFNSAVDLVFGRAGTNRPKLLNVARLAPLPSAEHPAVMFLGVKSDHKTAEFLVSSLAKPTGQGSCHPSARDCQLLDLKAGQSEAFLTVNSSGAAVEYWLTVSAVRLAQVPSPADAALAFARESHAGRDIVAAAWPSSVALHSISYSDQTGTLHSTPVSKTWLEQLTQALGGTPGSVALLPASTAHLLLPFLGQPGFLPAGL